MIFINEVVIWQLVRLIVILTATMIYIVDGAFVAFYLTLCYVFLTAVFTLTVDFLAYRVTEMDYHICLGVSPYQTILKYSHMPWFEANTDIANFYLRLIYRDPVGRLCRLEFPLLFITATISWCISNKNSVKSMSEIF